MRFAKTFLLAIFLVATFLPQSAFSQAHHNLVRQDDARRLGMEIMWRTQVIMGPRSNMQTIKQVFGKSKKLVKFIVTNGETVEEFFEDDVDRFGRKIGVRGAQERANARLERYKSIGFDTATVTRVVEDTKQLEAKLTDLQSKYDAAQGFEKVKLSQKISAIKARRNRLLPEITLLAQNSSTMVQSIDGRNGKTNWIQQIGKRNHPSLPIVVKRDHFAIINGSEVYCCLLENGRVLWKHVCRGAPGNRAAMTKNSIFIPMVNGFIEQFQIKDGNAPTGDIVSIGNSFLGATSSDSTVAWPSGRGELNVAYDTREAQVVSYRLVPKKKIVSNAAFLSPYLFATSTDGSIYCLREQGGTIMWDLPTGIPISKSPVPVGKFVYYIDDNDVLNQVTIDGGIPTWSTRNIAEIVSVSSKRIYCLNKQRHLIAYDVSTGGFIGALTSLPVEFVYKNVMTDRIIVGTNRGVIQCLREVDQVEAMMHISPEVANESKAQTKQKPRQGTTPPSGGNTNPFGGGADPGDPFGGGGAGNGGAGNGGAGNGGAGNGGGGSDPFGGGGSDPFGGGGSDPFGSGDGAASGGDASDPFK